MTKRIDIRVPDDIAEWFDDLRAALGGARGAQVLAMIRAKVPDASALLTEHSRRVPPHSVSTHGESRHTHGVVTDPGVPPDSVSAHGESRHTHGESRHANGVVTDPRVPPSPRRVPPDSVSTHGALTESPATLTEHSVSSSPLRGCDSRAPVPAFFSSSSSSSSSSLEENKNEETEQRGRLRRARSSRVVTFEFIASQWNRYVDWCADQGDDRPARWVEQPAQSTAGLAGVAMLMDRHPDPDWWLGVFDGLRRLDEWSRRTGWIKSLATLLQPTGNKPEAGAVCERIAAGEFVDVAPATLPEPAGRHPDPHADELAPDCDMGGYVVGSFAATLEHT